MKSSFYKKISFTFNSVLQTEHFHKFTTYCVWKYFSSTFKSHVCSFFLTLTKEICNSWFPIHHTAFLFHVCCVHFLNPFSECFSGASLYSTPHASRPILRLHSQWFVKSLFLQCVQTHQHLSHVVAFYSLLACKITY